MLCFVPYLQAHSENAELFEAPDKDFMIVALDLLSGLTEGLGHHIADLADSSNLLSLLYQCTQVYMVHSRDSLHSQAVLTLMMHSHSHDSLYHSIHSPYSLSVRLPLPLRPAMSAVLTGK